MPAAATASFSSNSFAILSSELVLIVCNYLGCSGGIRRRIKIMCMSIGNRKDKTKLSLIIITAVGAAPYK